MAKKNGKGAKLTGPLYQSGRTNGPVGGPKGGTSPRDPNGYLSNSGYDAPGGSPAEAGRGATDAPSSHHGR